jgi:hypothetical protein
MKQKDATLQFQRLMLPFKAVHIVALAEDGRPADSFEETGSANGFVRSEIGGLFLYTSWIVATGISRISRQIPPEWRRPTILRLGLRAYDSPVPGVQSIGPLRHFDVPLYEPMSRLSLWGQDAHDIPNSEINRVGLRVPDVHDAIKVRLPDLELAAVQLIDGNVPNVGVIVPGDKVLVVGHVREGDRPESEQYGPIAVTRHVAANRIDGRPSELILDGCCPDSFLGAPVFLERDTGLHAIGLYIGSVRAGRRSTFPFGFVCDMTRCWNDAEDWGTRLHGARTTSETLKH